MKRTLALADGSLPTEKSNHRQSACTCLAIDNTPGAAAVAIAPPPIFHWQANQTAQGYIFYFFPFYNISSKNGEERLARLFFFVLFYELTLTDARFSN